MSNLDFARGRQVLAYLRNQSGGSVADGDVVVYDTANDESFTTTTTPSQTAVGVGIAQEAILNGSNGRILVAGYAPRVNVNGSNVSAGNRNYYLFTSQVAKAGRYAATREPGAFGQLIDSGLTPAAIVQPLPDQTNVIGASITETTAQSLTHAVGAVMTSNDAELWDTHNFHNTSTSTERFTIPFGMDGKYRVTTNVYFAGNVTGIRQVQIRRNTSVVARFGTNAAYNAGYTTDVGGSVDLDLAAGDYVDTFAYQDSGGALNATLLRFSIEYLGD